MLKLHQFKTLVIIFLFMCILAAAVPTLASPTSPSEYRLSKYDVINIVIVGFSNGIFPISTASVARDSQGNEATLGLNEVMIGPDGNVNLPYAGSISLAGLTIREASTLLAERLGEYIKIPSLSVMVKQYGKRKVYVMGEVNKPGIYDLSSE